MSRRASGHPRGIPSPKPHPGFEALALRGKHHPGFHAAAKHEARLHHPVAAIPMPSGPPAPMASPNLAPVAPIGPPQMPAGGE